MNRPDWIKCIESTIFEKEQGKATMCGRTHTHEFLLTGISHALALVATESRLQPCLDCLETALVGIQYAIDDIKQKESND